MGHSQARAGRVGVPIDPPDDRVRSMALAQGKFAIVDEDYSPSGVKP